MSFLDRIATRLGYVRATAPIPFHASTSRYLGIEGIASQDVLLREADSWSSIATRAIADRIASLELNVVERHRIRAGTYEDEILDDHPLKAILDRPNPLHSRRATLRLLAQYIVTVGEGYLLKVTGPSQMIDLRELWPLLPSRVSPLADRGYVTGYKVTDGDGRWVEVSAEEVVRIWMPDPQDFYSAKGLLADQARTKDAQKFAEQSIRAFYQSDATPKSVIVAGSDAVLPSTDERQAFYNQWRNNYNTRAGLLTGIPPFLPSGFDLKVLQQQDNEGLVRLLTYWRDQIFMGYGVPRSIVGDVVDANRAAAETNQFVFDRHTVKPIADLIAEALTVQLAAPMFGPSIMVKFEDFISDDKDYLLKREAQDLELKVRPINEVRTDRGLDDVAWGDLPVGSFTDRPYDPENEPMEPAGPFGAEPEDEPEDEDELEPRSLSRGMADDEWLRIQARERLFIPAFERGMLQVFAAQRRQMLRVVRPFLRVSLERSRISEIIGAIKRLFMGRNAFKKLFDAKVERVRRVAYVSSWEDAVLSSAGKAKEFKFNPTVLAQLSEQAQEFRTQVNDTTAKQASEKVLRAIGQAVDEGLGLEATAKLIEDSVGETLRAQKGRIRNIARTEIGKATQRAQIQGFIDSEVVVGKTWNTSRDPKVRDSHRIDGQTVRLDGFFVLESGNKASEPFDARLPASDVVNCRCFVTPVTSEKEFQMLVSGGKG